jgi:hypothetical protein
MVLYPNKLPESERVCSGICKMLEDLINASATPYRKLKFTTESIVLESLNTRASNGCQGLVL